MFRYFVNAFLGAMVLAATPVAAQIANPSAFTKLQQDTEREIRSKLQPVLNRYCKDACEIVNIKIEIDEQIDSVDDLGFEGVMGDSQATDLYVKDTVVEIQVDDRVTAVNRERLRTIMMNNLAGASVTADVVWRPVTIPQIGTSLAVEEQLKRQLQGRVARVIDRVIEKYCPDTCVLSDVQVDGALLTYDEAAGLPPKQVFADKNESGILRVDAVDADVAMDLSLPVNRRSQIESIMQARLKFVEPVNLMVSAVSFPESYAERQAKLTSEAEDPYGLEKLRQMLIMFRDLAGTKEIINNTTTSASEKIDQSTSEKRLSAERALNQSDHAAFDPWQWFLIGVGLIAVLVILMLFYRLLVANRDAAAMTRAAEGGVAHSPMTAYSGNAEVTHKVEGGAQKTTESQVRDEIAMKLKAEDLRCELNHVFMELPKVAKETFARLLQEDGVEQTAKYVHIFGKVVVFELLEDPQLQRELYELSEYYHNSDVKVGVEEELKLLQSLKNKVTANEIKVMTRKQLDQFDFLAKLDAAQIYNLISEEKPQMQSIVLTQLDHKRRRAVFDMYNGAPKVSLMHELCRADAIPKDYLANVAKALAKKVQSRPEFDTENLRSSDILLDLLEKATLDEQRALMGNLMQTNLDAARGIKLKLVTIEMMPFLKDGHLLEMMLGLDRQDLMTFLAGTREHIRGLILSKAPEELAESWVEDLNNMAGFDEQAYRLTEMKILGRIRSLASNGAINLLDINDMIFGQGENKQDVEEQSSMLDKRHTENLVA